MKKKSLVLKRPEKPITILRLLLAIGDTSAPYNQFSLPLTNKHNITICTYFGSNTSPPPEITLFEGDGSLIGFLRALKSAFEEKSYDIIHSHAPHFGLLLLVAKLRYRKLLQPTIFTIHNSYQNFKFRNKLMLIPVFAFSQKVVCCGRASADSFPSFFKWLANERLCSIQNGVDIDRIDRIIGNKKQYPRNGLFTVVTVARLIELKNPLAVLNAFQQSTDLASSLVFIGEGNLRELLLTESQRLGLGRQVKLTGLLRREEVYKNLAGADVFISASRGEGLPVATLEAMACGCPVILSDIPPHREIADGVNFIPLIRPDDVTGFAREVTRFRQMPISTRVDIGQKCRELVEKRFSLTAMYKEYEGIYKQVLD